MGERDWFDAIADLRWQHVVLIVAALTAFAAVLIFSPEAGCSVSIDSSDTTTTTVER